VSLKILEEAVFKSESFLSKMHTQPMKKIIEQKGFPSGIYMDECSGGFEVSGNIVYNVDVPCFYHIAGHNQCADAVRVYDNYFNIYPGEDGFPDKIANVAGCTSNLIN
jgi:hypothetical protein